MTTESRHWAGRNGRLYRDRENGWIFGVCAGAAEYSNIDALAIRIIAVVCLLFFFVPTALVYLAAAFLLPGKPLIYAGEQPEYEFWRCGHRDDGWSHS